MIDYTRLIELFGEALLEVYNPLDEKSRMYSLYTRSQFGGFRYCLDTLSLYLKERDPDFDHEAFIDAVFTHMRGLS
jgi:hypothetical protein